MATTILTQERLKELLAYDPETGVFTNRTTRNPRSPIGSEAGYVNTIGYRVIQVAKTKVHAHRLAWLYVYGYLPKVQIDHINRVPSDNRLSNLRLATAAENSQNTKICRRNTSGHKGVTWHKHNKKWQAQLAVNNRHLYLGQFDSIEAAVSARAEAVKKYHAYATT